MSVSKNAVTKNNSVEKDVFAVKIQKGSDGCYTYSADLHGRWSGEAKTYTVKLQLGDKFAEDERLFGRFFETYAFSPEGVLKSLDLNGSNLSGCDLLGLSATDCQFEGANIKGSALDSCELEDCKFDEADMSDVSFVESKIEFTSFVHTDLLGAEFASAIMQSVDFSDADLSNAKFRDCDFSTVRLDGSCLDGTVFDGCRVFDVEVGEYLVHGTFPIGCSVTVTGNGFILRAFDDDCNATLGAVFVLDEARPEFNCHDNRSLIGIVMASAAPESWEWSNKDRELEAASGKLVSETYPAILRLLEQLEGARSGKDVIAAMTNAGAVEITSNVKF